MRFRSRLVSAKFSRRLPLSLILILPCPPCPDIMSPVFCGLLAPTTEQLQFLPETGRMDLMVCEWMDRIIIPDCTPVIIIPGILVVVAKPRMCETLKSRLATLDAMRRLMCRRLIMLPIVFYFANKGRGKLEWTSWLLCWCKQNHLPSLITATTGL